MTVKLQKYFVVVMVFIIIPYFIDQIDGFINLVLMQKMPLSKLYKTPMLFYAIGYTLYYDRQKKYSECCCLFCFSSLQALCSMCLTCICNSAM